MTDEEALRKIRQMGILKGRRLYTRHDLTTGLLHWRLVDLNVRTRHGRVDIVLSSGVAEDLEDVYYCLEADYSIDEV